MSHMRARCGDRHRCVTSEVLLSELMPDGYDFVQPISNKPRR